MKIRLNLDLAQWATDHDTSLHAIAQKAGVSHSTLYSLVQGGTVPSGATIAGLITATGLSFRTLFRVEK